MAGGVLAGRGFRTLFFAFAAEEREFAMFTKNWICFLAVAVALLVAGTAQACTIDYTFTEVPGDPVASMEGWTQIYPTDTVASPLWANYGSWGWMPDDGHLGTGWENADTQLGRSPAFTLDGSGEDLTFDLLGSASPLLVPDVAPSAIPEIAIDNQLVTGGFIGVGLRDIAADTYVLAKGLTANNYDTWTTLSFSATELASLGGVPGTEYTLDYIDYAKFMPSGVDESGFTIYGGGWFIMASASIPGVLVPIPEPSTLVLLAIGAIGLLGWAWRKRAA